MAGGEVNGAIESAAQNFVGNGGGGSESVAENRADAVLLENVDCEGGKFFGVEAGVVGDEDGGLGGFRFGVFGDGGDGKTDGGESEVVGDESAPAGSAEFDWGWRCSEKRSYFSPQGCKYDFLPQGL